MQEVFGIETCAIDDNVLVMRSLPPQRRRRIHENTIYSTSFQTSVQRNDSRKA